ncbi:pilus assembly protein PilP [Chitiniphilus eburneus]|uniref:Pilus assembly protein PilP n=1 Tax=Chitiniphilus eburneus TaxID=2571148 RepID=A0A4U0P8M0_9NEIS|nr:pilus assembly protein PilP [Chitiniphilus eburneus]TJZ63863.1 hypothetical protein FAZ21_19635 [Chitiniphilus eburneus]
MRNILGICALAICLNVGFSHAARDRQSLEAFDLSSLKIVKIYLNEKCSPFALVRDPNGYVHRAYLGDYVGKNFGVVKEINRRGLRIMELYGAGDEWEEKEIWFETNENQ